ncbi:hypothetical protein [Metallosphaera hakonensis]|uniref:Uncharacterized protein n=1 Tax=Metallosphaera hakonensis JCM 8857 = DSM 7519 TaxID=1293036 RepID=A0A2U9IU04_9CREN|nr:hypothetical protein [Metallosphaera hakonensis]AWR99551.1 hypothetical protein DFR87_07460 [Metallosphaera hakonensis JCM 8857 = DSM 7519]
MESEQKIRDVLVKFEEVIQNHSDNLAQLENIIAINQPDVERCTRIVRRMRRTRKEIYDGLRIILDHFSFVSDLRIKEETQGIVNYLGLIGFNDEIELLKSAEILLRKVGVTLDIREDIDQLEKLIEMTSKLSF